MSEPWQRPDAMVCRTVTGADIDLNGHMTAAQYFSAHLTAVRATLSGLGVSETYVAQRRMGTFAVEHHLRYVTELTEGDVFAVRVQVLDHSDKAIHLRSALTDERSGATANVLEVISVHVDLTTRRTTPFPADVMDRLDEAIRCAQDRPQRPRLTLHRSKSQPAARRHAVEGVHRVGE